MELTKEIWFDTNSMPPKNMIWYRGKGKFYEWRNDAWVVAYDLGNTPSQEELNDIADVIEDKTGEELQDKSVSGVLDAIVNALPEQKEGYRVVRFVNDFETIPANATAERVCNELSLSLDDLEKIMAGELNILQDSSKCNYLVLKINDNPSTKKESVAFLKPDTSSGFAMYMTLTRNKTTGLFTANEV